MKTLREAFLVTESVFFWAMVLPLAAIFEVAVLLSDAVDRRPLSQPSLEESAAPMARQGSAGFTSFWR
ncbi:MAG: hypothetical protein ACR2G0_10430 [Chthoniobacterales bacterium]